MTTIDKELQKTLTSLEAPASPNAQMYMAKWKLEALLQANKLMRAYLDKEAAQECDCDPSVGMFSCYSCEIKGLLQDVDAALALQRPRST